MWIGNPVVFWLVQMLNVKRTLPGLPPFVKMQFEAACFSSGEPWKSKVLALSYRILPYLELEEADKPSWIYGCCLPTACCHRKTAVLLESIIIGTLLSLLEPCNYSPKFVPCAVQCLCLLFSTIKTIEEFGKGSYNILHALRYCIWLPHNYWQKEAYYCPECMLHPNMNSLQTPRYGLPLQFQARAQG